MGYKLPKPKLPEVRIMAMPKPAPKPPKKSKKIQGRKT
jgi:hypothetical protein